MFASKGRKVIGVDVSQHVVDTINAGKIHIVEPDLGEMVKKVVYEGRLKAGTIPEPADVFIIAVPTPFLPNNSGCSTPQPDLSYIKTAAKSVAKVLRKGNVVILESTSPVGTTELLAAWLAEERSDLTFPNHTRNSDIKVAYCPERVLPGQILEELVKNDRVIGGMTDSCSEAAKQVYEIIADGACILTNSRTAEMTKLTENASRDVGIAFANELSVICDAHKIDVWEMIGLANRHPRVNILQPGPGVGGHCIAVDPWFIVSKNPGRSELIETARKVNDEKPYWVIDKVETLRANILNLNSGKSSDDVTIACFGLAFKPDIDDLRESPALKIVSGLAAMATSKILAVEPHISKLPESLPKNIELVSMEKALNSADICVLLVDHKEFTGVSSNDLAGKYIVDTKGIWSPTPKV